MKLRNKRTGQIVEDTDILGLLANVKLDIPIYRSLAEFNDEWEDYKPKEPLIKDEKIRKAVQTWAEANGINVVRICETSGAWGVRYDWEDDEIYSIDLLFKGKTPLGVGNQYTIAELCGEEEK